MCTPRKNLVDSNFSNCNLDKAIEVAENRFKRKIRISSKEFDTLFNVSYMKLDKGFFMKISLKDIGELV